jgi:broad specificity phosphatase PhoE
MSVLRTASSRTGGIYIVRHGDRYDREVGGWSGGVGWSAASEKHADINIHDPPLSALGQLQAQALGMHLSSSHSLTKLLVSPYIRTLQTLAPLSALTSLPLCVEDGLAEGETVIALTPCTMSASPPPLWRDTIEH